MDCKCGCGQATNDGKDYISGHNLKRLPRTVEHCRHISEGATRAWREKRKRKPTGSTNQDINGYTRVKILEKSGEWRKQHILIMEALIGRSLLPGEMIHHINGIRDDNRIENLNLCTKREHAIIEASCQSLVKELYRMGIVRFNKKDLRYEMV